MATWLDDNRTSGVAVGGDYDAIATWDSRTYRVMQATGQNNMHFIIDDVDTDISGGNVTRLNLKCERNPPSAALDIPALRTLLMGLSVDIPTTTDIEEGSLGAEDQPMIASKVQIGPDHTIEMENGVPVVSGEDADGAGTTRPLTSFHTMSMPYSAMDSNADGYRIIPRGDRSVFRYDGTGTGNIQLPAPPDIVDHDQLGVLLEFHNDSTNQNCVIRDFDGNALLTLYPGDYASFRIALRGNGEGGEIVGVSLPERQMTLTYQLGTVNAYAFFSSFPWWTFNNTYRSYLIAPNPNNLSRHTDVFRVVSTVPPIGDQGNLADEDDFNYRGAIEILKDGDLELEVGIKIYSSTATGIIDDNWSLRTEKIAVGNVSRGQFGHNRESAFSGLAERREIETNHFGKVSAGEIILPTMRYPTSGTTYAITNLRLSDHWVEAKFNQKINVEWSL